MEDVIKQIKKLRSIEADKRFTEQSRLLILGTPKQKNSWGGSVLGAVLKNLELGASFALAGILVITILGGFSAWKFLSPLKLSNLDTTGLTAEAQAVDIQIQLTNLAYGEIAAKSTTPSFSEERPVGGSKAKTAPEQPEQENALNGAATSSPSEGSLSIEEALEKLSE